MFSLESEEMTVLWSNDASTLTFYVTISNSIPNWTTIVEELFDLMLRSESDKMTAVWPNDSRQYLTQQGNIWHTSQISDEIR